MTKIKIVYTMATLTLVTLVITALHFAQLPGGRSLDTIFTIQGRVDAIKLYGEIGIQHHIVGTTTLDTIFPIVYTIAIALALIRFVQQPWRSLLILLVLLAFLTDFVENYFHLMALNGREIEPIFVIATYMKYLFLCAPAFFAIRGIVTSLKNPD